MSAEYDDYAGLERGANPSSGASSVEDEIDLGATIDFDGTDVALPSKWDDGTYCVMCVEIKAKTARSGNRMLEVTHNGIEPEHKDQPLYDRVMLDGKGKARFVLWARALGLWDVEKNALRKGTTYADFLFKPFWADVENRKEQYVTDMGEEKTIEKSVIAFAGFHPFGSRPAPWAEPAKPEPPKDPNDPFENS
jgi:uncharacterized protein DUF669